MFSFDLIAEPWLPCHKSDGSAVELGLRETLLRAHELAELRDGSPLVTAALHRLLLALLHRIVDGPQNREHWVQLWKAGCFSKNAIDSYFGKWSDRFDLFHEKYPFYQVADFEIVDSKTKAAKSPAPISVLFQELATGNNPTVFDHARDEPNLEKAPLALTPAEAARRLVAAQFFSLGGGKGPTSNRFGEHPYSAHAPGAGRLFALAQGNTLFQTLALNLLFPPFRPALVEQNDRPAWEANLPSIPAKTRPLGYLDFLTFSARCVRLIPDERNGTLVVSRLHYAQGMWLTTDAPSPFSPFRLDTDGEPVPLGLHVDKAVWRDSHVLFLKAVGADKKHDPRPAAIRQVCALTEFSDAVLPILRCSIVGLASDKASALLWRHEELPLPKALLVNEELPDHLFEGLKKCEEIGKIVRNSLWRLALYVVSGKSTGDHQKKEKELAFIMAERAPYWERLELPFHTFLLNLTKDAKKAREEWLATCKRTARDAFDEGASLLVGNIARDLKEWAKAKPKFDASLKSVR